MNSEYTRVANVYADMINYMTHEEIDLLQVISQSLPPNPVVINIGAGVGTSGLSFLGSRDDLVLYTVDINGVDNPIGGLIGEKNLVESIPDPNRARWHQILGDSKEVGKTWGKGSVDLVFVDGDHTEEGVTGDIQNWLPHIKSNGYIVLHDYGWPFSPDVKIVVDKYFKGQTPTHQLPNMIVFKMVASEKPAKKRTK